MAAAVVAGRTAPVLPRPAVVLISLSMVLSAALAAIETV